MNECRGAHGWRVRCLEDHGYSRASGPWILQRSRDAGLAQLAGAPGNEGKFNLDGTGEKGKKRYGPPTSQHRPSGCFSNAQDGA